MSDAHEIVTLGEPREHAESPHLWVAVKIECSECDHVEFTGVPEHEAEARTSWIADHIAQHAPGRALDIEVDWEPSACCSVCEGGIGDIRQVSSEGLECIECGTAWDNDGTMGETNGA